MKIFTDDFKTWADKWACKVLFWLFMMALICAIFSSIGGMVAAAAFIIGGLLTASYTNSPKAKQAERQFKDSIGL